MKIQSLKLAFFSPSGTTSSIIQGVIRGINYKSVKLIDITRPEVRKQQLRTSENELLVVAVPVYMGRVPALLMEWLHKIKAQRTPAACIVVYGNREYDDALLELKNIIAERGCIPIACAAYIGEHSFSSSKTPIAEARPDISDLKLAELFGHRIAEKLQTISSIDHIPAINIPGNYPYRGDTKLWDVDFIAISDECTECGICVEVCPVGAIVSGNGNLIDIEKCITCCACIKSCPQNARTIKNGLVKDAAIRLNKFFNARKEPEFFF